MPAPSAEDLLGKSLGPYRIETLLGQGGFAWVFAGRDAAGAPVAVKVLKPRYAGDPQFESRFRNESETAARLEHPNIIRIRAVGRDGDHVYFAMDLYQESLAARVARAGPLPEAALVRVATDVAQGLGFAHAQGIVHRDLKADNVLLDEAGHAVISDFGVARAISGYVTSTGVNMTVGTPQYLSPEQAQGRPVDQRADFYALGVTLYKAATGEVPFTHTDWFELARMHVEQPPPAPRRKRPELSKRFERVIVKCLAKHPDDRYQSAAELLADLEPRESGGRATLEVGMAPVVMDAAPAGRRRRGWWTAALVLAAVIALAALVARLMR